MTLRPPARVALLESTWSIGGRVLIRGEEFDEKPMPWFSMPDLLIERQTRRFVGLTFWLYDHEWADTKAIIDELDPRVIRYNDVSSSEAKRLYGESGEHHWCELQWAPATELDYDLAQLMCGQWVCLYKVGEGLSWTDVPVGFALTHIDEILRDHHLTFPEIPLPALEGVTIT
jgi:hypothetical protein